ncbi:hypothetical protein C8Q80DRAFT_1146823 [Daedaleopsis nitida]|nr:hypothetical protein C8Q80DRAFT_1146823 [Daedaleopsis nitida]
MVMVVVTGLGVTVEVIVLVVGAAPVSVVESVAPMVESTSEVVGEVSVVKVISTRGSTVARRYQIVSTGVANFSHTMGTDTGGGQCDSDDRDDLGGEHVERCWCEVDVGKGLCLQLLAKYLSNSSPSHCLTTRRRRHTAHA